MRGRTFCLPSRGVRDEDPALTRPRIILSEAKDPELAAKNALPLAVCRVRDPPLSLGMTASGRWLARPDTPNATFAGEEGKGGDLPPPFSNSWSVQVTNAVRGLASAPGRAGKPIAAQG